MLTDLAGSFDPALKIKLDGREMVLASWGERTWSAGDVTVTEALESETITDNPAYGYRKGTLTITQGSDSHVIDVIEYGGC